MISNDDRPFQGKQYTIAVVTTTDRTEAVRLDRDDLTDGDLTIYPSFVNPWSLQEFEHTEIYRRVAQVSDDVIRAVVVGISHYHDLKS